MKKKGIKAKLVSAVFCKSITKGELEAPDCKGIFTSLLAWAYPTSQRTWYAVLTAYGLPQGSSTINASIARRGGKKTTISTADIEQGKPDIGHVISMPLRFVFPQEGFYTVYFNIVGTTEVLKVPLLVATQPWPTITKQEREFIKNDPTLPHPIRVTVNCSDCSQPYTFEENVLPDELAKGVRRFPESGILECEKCSHLLNLSDIRGQIRGSIKSAVVAAMRGRK